jgi:hypothetical protein
MLVDMEYIGGNFSASSQNVDRLKGVVKQRRISQWSMVTSMGHTVVWCIYLTVSAIGMTC